MLHAIHREVFNHCRTYPLEQVSRRATGLEADPREAGLSPRAVEEIWRSVEQLYLTGLYPAVGFCLRRANKVLIDGTIGHVRGNAPHTPAQVPKVIASPETPFCLFSASKAITAMLIHHLDEQRLLHLDDPVVEYLPEFGKHGKEWVTLRHILTHRAGIPSVPCHSSDPSLLLDWDRMINLLCDTSPVAPPGRRLAYHALTGGFILGEVVRRVTGRTVRELLDEKVRRPLGFANLGYGCPVERMAYVAENAFTGPRAFPPFAGIMQRAIGVPFETVAPISNDAMFLTGIIPSGNIVATANETGRFFELLLNGGTLDGVQVFERRTVKRAIAEQSYLELDLTVSLPVSYGMGFVLGTESFSLYGRETPRAFGHIGFSNIVAWADPERDISVCLLTSGKPLVHRGLVKWFNVMGTVSRECMREPRREIRNPARA